MSDAIFFAPLRVPLTDPNTGLMSRPWYLFFQAMFNRVGGTTGASNDDLEQLVNENLDISDVDAIATAQQLADSQLTGLDADTMAADIQALQSQFADITARLEDASVSESPTQNALDDVLALASTALDDATAIQAAALSGAFTPTVVGSTTAGVGTYVTQQGNYTRIGDRLIFNLRLKWSATTGTGNLRIGGLPFPSNAAANTHSVPCAYANSGITDITACLVLPGGTQIEVDKFTVGVGVAALALPAAAELWISGSYLL
jgi:hypothetical protein